jgi:hypothetical protein
MTKLLDLIRDCRHRQVEELDIIKVGDHELKMKNGKFWSEGRFWTLEEMIIESMRLRALPEPDRSPANTPRIYRRTIESMRLRALPEPEAGRSPASAPRIYRRGGR